MNVKKTLSVMLLLVCPCLLAQPAKRLAILPANGKFGEIENLVTDRLTGKLAGADGLTIIDRASIDKILKEQNFQNSDRSSLDTAARIGKLVGAGQIVLVQVPEASYSTHPQASGNTVTNMGTVILQVHARVIDVETAVILGQPLSSFQDSAVISETKINKGSRGIHIGMINTPPTQPSQKTTGSDPKVVADNEWSKAIESVTTELKPELESIMARAPGPKAELPLVAGIAQGSVYINEGAAVGIKPGDRFQVVRKVNVGLNDPKTGQPITQRRQICVLAVTNVDDNNASGTCQGGLPQSGDVAEPMRP